MMMKKVIVLSICAGLALGCQSGDQAARSTTSGEKAGAPVQTADAPKAPAPMSAAPKAAPVAGPVQSELAIGSKAPAADIDVMDVSGKSLTLAGVKSANGLLVIFSCNTCPWVLAWEGRYNGLAQAARDAGIGMIALNSNEANRDGDDSLDEMRAHAEKNGYTFPYAVDPNSAIANAFGATRTPHVFLFDKDLTLVYRGAIDDNAKQPDDVKAVYLLDAIRAVGSGSPVAVKDTKSIGCSIKRI